MGKAAPDFKLQDDSGNTVSLKDYRGAPLVIYFYPKADTPGCTREACAFRDSQAALKRKGVVVLGVSGDKPEAQKAFRDKFTFPFPLIADDDGKLAAAFGVPGLEIVQGAAPAAMEVEAGGEIIVFAHADAEFRGGEFRAADFLDCRGRARRFLY